MCHRMHINTLFPNLTDDKDNNPIINRQQMYIQLDNWRTINIKSFAIKPEYPRRNPHQTNCARFKIGGNLISSSHFYRQNRKAAAKGSQAINNKAI